MVIRYWVRRVVVILPPPPEQRTPPKRKHLSADALYALLRLEFDKIADHRGRECPISLTDALMSAFSMFALKDPSLLAFEERRNDENMGNLFGIARVPSDTHMREILDPVEPQAIRPLFNAVFRQLQRGKALEPFVFHHGCYLLSLDGTGYFSSSSIHCDSCLEKVHRQTQETTYQHQMLAAVMIHPDHREVIPFAPEPIVKQDGTRKNDCERNAAKRLLRQIRREHPHLKLIVVEDGLASNAPHIRELQSLNMHFILGAKPGDHDFLWDQVLAAWEADRVTTISWTEGNVYRELSFINDVPLNESNQDLRVNWLHCYEIGPDGEERTWTWVTDLKISRQNARCLVKGGRCRWKIENETFNTLKNQGYHFEHNYGHGKKNLSVVFAMLMMLAFLVDQVQQLCCPLFKAVRKKLTSKRALWDNLRSHFRHFVFRSMRHLYEVILYDLAKQLPAPTRNTC
ncbi:MAG TPA: transposase [Terriglobales bacterium]|nr:transposase [Terriglobales bacterium]